MYDTIYEDFKNSVFYIYFMFIAFELKPIYKLHRYNSDHIVIYITYFVLLV